MLNLTAYESFFDERRPFFVAGRGLFRFDVNCSQVNCNNEGLYYSRRIGRTPELAGTYGDTVPQQPTTILGAAKLLGRFPGGLIFGVLDAATQRAVGTPATPTYEPRRTTRSSACSQDLRNGNSTVGGMLTAVDRNMRSWSSPYLPPAPTSARSTSATAFSATTTRCRGRSTRAGVREAAPRSLGLQTDAVHYYQRPDAGLPLDSNRTVLAGDAEEFKFDKVGGQHLMFESAYQRRSPGFEINDIGYLRRADQTSWNTWVGVFDRRARRGTIGFQWNNNWWQYWTTAGCPSRRRTIRIAHITFKEQRVVQHRRHDVGQLGTDLRRPRRARRAGVPPGLVPLPRGSAFRETTGAPSCRCSRTTTSTAAPGRD